MYLGTSSSVNSKAEKFGISQSAVQTKLGKGSGMALDRLTDTSPMAVELYSTLDLEHLWVGGISRNTNEYKPLLIRSDVVVDDLCAHKSHIPVKDLHRSGGCVSDTPMVNGGLGN